MTQPTMSTLSLVFRKLHFSKSLLAAVVVAGSMTNAVALVVGAGEIVDLVGNQDIGDLSMQGGTLKWSDSLSSVTNVMNFNVANSATLSRGFINHTYTQSGTPSSLRFLSGAIVDGAGSTGAADRMFIGASNFDVTFLNIINSGVFSQRDLGELQLLGQTGFINAAGAKYEIGNNLGVLGGPTRVFQNSTGAELSKSDGFGTSKIDLKVSNSGTISVYSGQLWLASGGNHQDARIGGAPVGVYSPYIGYVQLSGAHAFSGNVTTDGAVNQEIYGSSIANHGTWSNRASFGSGFPSQSASVSLVGAASRLENSGYFGLGGIVDGDGEIINAAAGTSAGVPVGTIQVAPGGHIRPTSQTGGPESRANITNSGDFLIDGPYSVGGGGGMVQVKNFTNDGGRLVVNGTLETSGGQTRLLGGVLSGNGIINGDVFVGGGPGTAVFTPGNSPGTMTINGAFSLLPGGVLDIDVESDGAGGISFDRVLASSMFLNGQVNLLVGAGVNDSDVADLSFIDCGGCAISYGDNFSYAFPGRPGSALIADASGLHITTMTSLAPVPEPETYALMLAGLALVAATLRRSRFVAHTT